MRLSDIRAQEAAVRSLLSSLRRQQVAHASLFSGPKGVGKTSTALAFASALNCMNPGPDGDACGTCLSCLRIEAGEDADVKVICPDGNQTKIDQMHEMIKSLSFAPLSGKYKVFIIEQADTLNSSSENCILKILEEPPSYGVLILLSRNPNSLLPTIRSRCRLVRFRRASASEIESAVSEHTEVTGDDAHILAACSQGSIGTAIRMSASPDFLNARAEVLNLIKDWTNGPTIQSLQTAETMRDMAKPPKNNPESQTQVKNLTAMLEYILAWYSDILVLKIRGQEAPLINVDYLDDMLEVAERYSIDRLRTCIRAIMETRRLIEGNITPQLALENMLFSLQPDA